jgi:hypothetical protein
MSNYTTLNYADVSVGDKLPPLEVPITSSLITCAALATRDFEPVHHNASVAKSTGLPNVFMNILTSQGFMTRYVTDWSGPEAMVNSLDIRLGAPNVDGMSMTVTGEITAKDDESGKIDVAVLGENNIWGMHMQGTVQITLPQEA